jgi:type I restriction enzyme S subunit
MALDNLSKDYDLKFLYHYFGQRGFNDVISGSAQPQITRENLSKVEVPKINLATQQRIAAILDKADAIIQNNRAIVQKYDALTQSLFLDMFGDPVKNEKGWETSILKNVTSKIGSGSTPRGGKESYKTEGISLIRSMNVYDNEFYYKDLAFIDNIQADKLKNVIVEENDVLFNITGASVCRCAIVPKNILPARVNQHVAIIRPKKEILNYFFLNHLLISIQVKRDLLKLGSGGGAVMEAITKEQLENYFIRKGYKISSWSKCIPKEYIEKYLKDGYINEIHVIHCKRDIEKPLNPVFGAFMFAKRREIFNRFNIFF